MIKVQLFFLTLICINAYAQKTDTAFLRKYFDNIQNNNSHIIGNNFKTFDVISISNHKFSNNDLENKITLINFWFKDCPPCIAEFSSLNKLLYTFQKSNVFQLLTFTFESKEEIKKVIDKYNLQFEVLPVSKSLCYQLNYNNGFPTIIITNKAGKIVYIDSAGSTDSAEVKNKFDKNIIPFIQNLIQTD